MSSTTLTKHLPNVDGLVDRGRGHPDSLALPTWMCSVDRASALRSLFDRLTVKCIQFNV